MVSPIAWKSRLVNKMEVLLGRRLASRTALKPGPFAPLFWAKGTPPPAPKRLSPQHDPRELDEVVEPLPHDRADDVEVQALIVVDGDGAEADHALHAIGE